MRGLSFGAAGGLFEKRWILGHDSHFYYYDYLQESGPIGAVKFIFGFYFRCFLLFRFDICLQVSQR